MDWKKCRFPYLKETVRYCKRIPNTYIAQKHKLRPKVVEKTISCEVGECHAPKLATEIYRKSTRLSTDCNTLSPRIYACPVLTVSTTNTFDCPEC